jgi:hypothetical protein
MYMVYFSALNKELFTIAYTQLERVAKEVFTIHGWRFNLWIDPLSP